MNDEAHFHVNKTVGIELPKIHKNNMKNRCIAVKQQFGVHWENLLLLVLCFEENVITETVTSERYINITNTPFIFVVSARWDHGTHGQNI